MTIQYKPEGSGGKGWQTTALSALFAILMMVAGWLWVGVNTRQDRLEQTQALQGEIDTRQDIRAAVQENETKNLKDSIERVERKIDGLDSKLDQALRKH